jgi:hypothetical protein
VKEQRTEERSQERPVWDQSPIAAAYTADLYTLSHATTTADSESVRPDENEDGIPRRKKAASPSVYSFNSSRDFSLFAKNVHGRFSLALSNQAYGLIIGAGVLTH